MHIDLDFYNIAKDFIIPFIAPLLGTFVGYRLANKHNKEMAKQNKELSERGLKYQMIIDQMHIWQKTIDLAYDYNRVIDMSTDHRHEYQKHILKHFDGDLYYQLSPVDGHLAVTSVVALCTNELQTLVKQL